MSIDSIIRQLYKDCLIISESKKERNAEMIYGHYISLNTKELEGTKEIFRRLFINCNKCGRRVMLGESNASDVENILGMTLEFIYVALKEVFTGARNEKLNKALQVNSIEDINNILEDKYLATQLSKYIFVEVQNKFKAHIQVGNPDFEIYSEDGVRKFKPIKKVYISENKEEILVSEEEKARTGSLTNHIFTQYREKLTKKQQQWVDTVLEYGFGKDGATYNHQNELIYSKQLNNEYIKTIRERLLPWIETDQHIDTVGGDKPRWKYRK